MKAVDWLVPLLLFSLMSCSEGDEEEERERDEDGLAQCCEIGALCHVHGTDVDPEVDDCHDLGHRNDPVQCRSHYEHCIGLCAGLNEAPSQHACK